MADLYELQRAMRAMRQSALQRGALAILDLGSTKIGCLILRFDGLDPSLASDQVGFLAGQSSFQVVGSAITRSRGIEFGEISSMQEAERAIRTVLQSAQKMANLGVDHLIACFSGESRVVFSRGSTSERIGTFFVASCVEVWSGSWVICCSRSTAATSTGSVRTN